MGRIKGETVFVSLREWGAEDELGNAVEVYSDPVETANVLVGKGSTNSRISDGHEFGYETDVSFCFPRGYNEDLRGARITRAGIEYEVVGQPKAITDENIPGGIDWNIKAQGVRYGG